VTSTGKVYINLTPDGDDYSVFDGHTLIDADGGVNISDIESLFADVGISSGGNLIYNGAINFDGAIENVADKLGVVKTRNMGQIADLLSEIRDSMDYGGFAKEIQDIIVTLSAMYDSDPEIAANYFETFLKQSAGESIIGVIEGLALTSFKSNGVILGRLDRIYQNDLAVPPAAGAGDLSNRIWVGGFGSWARQNTRDNVDGYDYDTGGISLGYDRLVQAVPGLRLGLSASFATGNLESKNRLSKIDVDTVSFGLYGSYVFQNAVFIDATTSYGSASNDSEVAVPGGGVKKGDFDINTWLIGARVGRIFSFDNVNITPTLGLRYLSFSQDGFTETMRGAGFGIPNWFAKKSDQILEVPLQVKISGVLNAGSTEIVPELRLGWTLMAKKPDNELNMGFRGINDHSTTVYGTKPKTNSFQVGAGLKINFTENVDFYVNYDLDLSKGYRNHMASGGLGFNF
jgi:outer membrane autotransporter protein